MVRVAVLKAGEIDGRIVQRGEIIAIDPVTAAVLARKGVISLSRVSETKAITAEPVRSDTRSDARPKRRYRRRDLVAED